MYISPFICPQCHRTSYHPEDERHGYCGNCHDFTGARATLYERIIDPFYILTVKRTDGQFRIVFSDIHGCAFLQLDADQARSVAKDLIEAAELIDASLRGVN